MRQIDKVTEKFSKTQKYSLDKARFGFVSSLISQIQSTWIIVYEILPWLWSLSDDLLIYAGYEKDHEVVVNLLIYLIIVIYFRYIKV